MSRENQITPCGAEPGTNLATLKQVLKEVSRRPLKPVEANFTQPAVHSFAPIPNLAFHPKAPSAICKSLQKDYNISEQELIGGFGAAGECVLAIKYYENNPSSKYLIPNFLSFLNISPLASRVLAVLKKPTEKVGEKEILTTKMQIINKLFISQSPSLPAVLTSDNDQLKQEYTAVVLDSLIKINQILEFSLDKILLAAGQFVKSNNVLKKKVEKKLDQTLEKFMNSDDCIDTKITTILSYIIPEDPIDLEYLTQLVPFMCDALGIKDPEEIEDESNEPHGFWAKMKHAIFHPIEFFKVKILGKEKTSELDGDHGEMRGNGSAKDFPEEQASYFTYVKDTVFSIINLSWLFSSTGGGEPGPSDPDLVGKDGNTGEPENGGGDPDLEHTTFYNFSENRVVYHLDNPEDRTPAGQEAWSSWHQQRTGHE